MERSELQVIELQRAVRAAIADARAERERAERAERVRRERVVEEPAATARQATPPPRL
jgi:hypothetical protein